MQVYADIERIEDARVLVAEICTRLDQCRHLPAGLERHQTLVSAFVRASELIQGVIDADFYVTRSDAFSERHQAGQAILTCFARAVALSWESGFTKPSFPQDCASLQLFADAGAIRTKQAEGYAFYALYPEAYIAAAQQSGLGPQTTVIGIRSIGIGLAAIVAAAIGAPSSFSVRPIGHPFDRRLALGHRLAARLLEGSGPFAIVDEGPGLSGSSFNCVADWLVGHGVVEQRIHFFPSHGGELGDAASLAHRRRWSGANKHVANFEQTILHASRPEHRLQNWIASAVGPLTGPLQDISGGAWRRHGLIGTSPPADPALEKRKFLAVAADGESWLAKFAGIGTSGEAKLRLAHQLSYAGFAPPPVGLRYGFLITSCLRPQLHPDRLPPQERVLDYLAFRACLPAAGAGASLEQLSAMAVYNFGQHWGTPAANAVRTALGDANRFMPVPCCTDNRMHAWEWLPGAGGWQKLDGLDHHAAHDMVGCQDIAWDVAGAAVEFGMTQVELDTLVSRLEVRIARAVDRQFIAFNELCYLGFQIGLWTMALSRNGPAEQGRIRALIGRYEQRAREALAARVV